MSYVLYSSVKYLVLSYIFGIYTRSGEARSPEVNFCCVDLQVPDMILLEYNMILVNPSLKMLEEPVT